MYPLSTIFGLPRQLLAPLFQRPYVWERDRQWEPLWEDICGVAEAVHAGTEAIKPHFLGAIVLDQQLMPMRHIETRFIIDGQQRLATLQVFFAAFRDACRGALADSPVPEGIEEMMYNTSKMLEEDLERFKVLPTTPRPSARSSDCTGRSKTTLAWWSRSVLIACGQRLPSLSTTTTSAAIMKPWTT